MQRREQQRRAASGGGSSSYLSGIGGGASGYSAVPRYEAPEPPASRTPTTTSSSTPRPPAFKSGGMKLGAKKSKQNELLDALAPELAASPQPEYSQPNTPAVDSTPASRAPVAQYNERGSVPEVEPERHVGQLSRSEFVLKISPSVHIVIKETLSLSLLRDGGVQSMELKGDMNLLISDPEHTHLRLTLSEPTDFGGNGLQFKQHPNVAKFTPGQPRVVALKDSSRAFPVNQSLAVLKWRYAGTDESNVPLSSEYCPYHSCTWLG